MGRHDVIMGDQGEIGHHDVIMAGHRDVIMAGHHDVIMAGRQPSPRRQAPSRQHSTPSARTEGISSHGAPFGAGSIVAPGQIASGQPDTLHPSPQQTGGTL
jgi:hypothetical protein